MSHGENGVRLQDLHRAPPRDSVGCEAGMETCSERETGTGLSHCRHEGLVMVWDRARLRRGYDDQLCQGHQCSKTTLTGESWFHISPPRGFEPRSLVTGSKGLVHWTSETWWEPSEIAGSPQAHTLPLMVDGTKHANVSSDSKIFKIIYFSQLLRHPSWSLTGGTTFETLFWWIKLLCTVCWCPQNKSFK